MARMALLTRPREGLPDRSAFFRELGRRPVEKQIAEWAALDSEHVEAELYALRAIAWFRELQKESGTKTIAALNKTNFDKIKGGDLRWSSYRDGKLNPATDTVESVAAKYPGTAKVFAKGPLGHPLWSILDDDLHHSLWRAAVDDWLEPTLTTSLLPVPPPAEAKVPAEAEAIVEAEALAKPEDPVPKTVKPPSRLRATIRTIPLMDKIAMACNWLVPLPPDFSAYAAGRQRNLVVLPPPAHPYVKMADIAPLPIVGVLALWRLAESERSLLRETRHLPENEQMVTYLNMTRYLARGILPWVKEAFAPWGIGERLHDYLDIFVPFPNDGALYRVLADILPPDFD